MATNGATPFYRIVDANRINISAIKIDQMCIPQGCPTCSGRNPMRVMARRTGNIFANHMRLMTIPEAIAEIRGCRVK